MPERGQTEVLGYVLVFSVIVLTVALVTVSGQAGLREVRDNQRTANIEEGFVALADNIDQVSQGGVPSRATELKLSGDSIALGSPVTVTVTAEQSGTEVLNRSISLRPIVYRSGNDARVVYTSGAVIGQGPGGGAVMLRRPQMLLSSNRTVVPVVNTSRDRRQLRGNPGAVSRESEVLVRAERREIQILGRLDTSASVTLTVTSPRAEAWVEYLETEINPGTDNCTLTDATTASCTYTADQITVVQTRVAVGFE